jgi:ribonuclease VapC
MIVDTSALFAIIFNEPDFRQFILKLLSAKGNLAMSVATQVEAHVVAQRSGVQGAEEELERLIADYDIAIVPLSPMLGKIAIDAHRQYGRQSGSKAKLNYGDCFSYALAKERGEPLVYKGKDFAFTDIDGVVL